MLGARVTVSGVVTAAFRGTTGGFFLQDPSCDGDAATTDALWSWTRRARGLARDRRPRDRDGPGRERLRSHVRGRGERADEGATRAPWRPCGPARPADPVAAAAYLESQEGMLVRSHRSRVVAATDATGIAYVLPDASGVTRLFRGGRGRAQARPCAPEGGCSRTRVTSRAAAGALVETRPASPCGCAGRARPPSTRRGARGGRRGRAGPGPSRASPPTTSTRSRGLRSGRRSVTPGAAELRDGASIGVLDSCVVVQGADSADALADLAADPSLIAYGYRPVLARRRRPAGLHVGLLYRADHVSLRGVRDAARRRLRTGAPLVVHLQTAQGERFAVVGCDFQPAAGSVDAAAVRMGLADHVRALAGEIRLAEPDARLVVLGNLDDGEASAPVLRLLAGGLLSDLHGRLPVERPYTLVAQGVSLTSDYVLVDAALSARVTELRAVHVNADWGRAAPGAEAASPRAADHDPLLLRVRLP